MNILKKLFCGLMAVSFIGVFLIVENSWAGEGIWTVQHFRSGGQEYAICLRRDEPEPGPKSYYISHTIKDPSGDACGEEEIHRNRAVVDEIIIGEDFFNPGEEVVVFLHLQNKGYLSGFELLKFDHSVKKLVSFHRQQVQEEGNLLTVYEGNLILWRGLKSNLVLFDKKRKIKIEECLLGIIPSPAGGIFLELERTQKGSVSWFTQKFSGAGKSLKMAEKEKLIQPITLEVGQHIIILRTGGCRDVERFKVGSGEAPVLKPFNFGLPTVLKAVKPGTSLISIELEGKNPMTIDIEVVVLESKKTDL